MRVFCGVFDSEPAQALLLMVCQELVATVRDVQKQVCQRRIPDVAVANAVRGVLVNFRTATQSHEQEETLRIEERHNGFAALLRVMVYSYAKHLCGDVRVGIMLPSSGQFMHQCYAALVDTCDPVWMVKTNDYTSRQIAVMTVMRSVLQLYVHVDTHFAQRQTEADDALASCPPEEDVQPHDSASNIVIDTKEDDCNARQQDTSPPAAPPAAAPAPVAVDARLAKLAGIDESFELFSVLKQDAF